MRRAGTVRMCISDRSMCQGGRGLTQASAIQLLKEQEISGKMTTDVYQLAEADEQSLRIMGYIYLRAIIWTRRHGGLTRNSTDAHPI